MGDPTDRVIFQMPPDQLSDEMLRWLTDHGVYVPDLSLVVLFRMAPSFAEEFTGRFPDTLQYLMGRK